MQSSGPPKGGRSAPTPKLTPFQTPGGHGFSQAGLRAEKELWPVLGSTAHSQSQRQRASALFQADALTNGRKRTKGCTECRSLRHSVTPGHHMHGRAGSPFLLSLLSCPGRVCSSHLAPGRHWDGKARGVPLPLACMPCLREPSSHLPGCGHCEALCGRTCTPPWLTSSPSGGF
jgi:hypothetical protein